MENQDQSYPEKSKIVWHISLSFHDFLKKSHALFDQNFKKNLLNCLNLVLLNLKVNNCRYSCRDIFFKWILGAELRNFVIVSDKQLFNPNGAKMGGFFGWGIST